MIKDGYLIVATGVEKYLALARNAARSLRHFDRKRGIALLCDREIKSMLENGKEPFDYIHELPTDLGLIGTEIHLYLNQYTPFEKTIYVDSDCLASRSGLDSFWEDLKNYSVTFPGRKLQSGFWRKVIEQLNSDF